MRRIYAKVFGWLQLGVILLGEAIHANGFPRDFHAWAHIFASAAITAAVHHASQTDGSH